MQESRNMDPWQHSASAKPVWSIGTRRELRGGLAESLIAFLREGESLRAVVGRRVAGMSHRAPRFCRFRVEVGFVVFSAAVSFSVQGVHIARLKKEPGLKKGRACVPGRSCRTGAARLSAPRRRRSRRLGAALSARCIGQLALRPAERLPLQRCVRTCTDLAENVRSTLFVWTSARVFFLPPKKILVGQAKFTASF